MYPSVCCGDVQILFVDLDTHVRLDVIFFVSCGVESIEVHVRRSPCRRLSRQWRFEIGPVFKDTTETEGLIKHKLIILISYLSRPRRHPDSYVPWRPASSTTSAIPM